MWGRFQVIILVLENNVRMRLQNQRMLAAESVWSVDPCSILICKCVFCRQTDCVTIRTEAGAVELPPLYAHVGIHNRDTAVELCQIQPTVSFPNDQKRPSILSRRSDFRGSLRTLAVPDTSPFVTSAAEAWLIFRISLAVSPLKSAYFTLGIALEVMLADCTLRTNTVPSVLTITQFPSPRTPGVNLSTKSRISPAAAEV